MIIAQIKRLVTMAIILFFNSLPRNSKYYLYNISRGANYCLNILFEFDKRYARFALAVLSGAETFYIFMPL